MADYNIYVRAIGTGVASNQSPTTPWSQREDGGGASQTASYSGGSSGTGINAAFAVTRAAGYAQNPDSIINTGITSIAKALPWVAAAYAVVKLGVSVADNALDFKTIETGSYSSITKWQNFKQSVNNVFHPVSSIVNSYKTNLQWQKENEKLQAQRDLLGDSVINSYTGRGV